MVEMEIKGVQISSKAYHRVVLKEKDGEAYLHIVIGPNEARAISLAHNDQSPARPLSYDLACSLLEEAEASIRRVAITELHEGIYYAEVHLENADGTTVNVDSRPSDAIALAVRTDAPIFAAKSVLDEEGSTELEEEEEVVNASSSESTSLADLLASPSQTELSEIDLLRKRLAQAVSEEAYEEAARLRDRIALLEKPAAEELGEGT
jgi:bifunctional DNase/RNase